MTTSNSWSEQVLAAQDIQTNENGTQVVKRYNVLSVCLGDTTIYHDAFVEGKYKNLNSLHVAFDFIMVSGNTCPHGAFYELSYFIGKMGKVYRALIQASNPVIDLPIIVATLKNQSLLPADCNPIEARLRDDIELVCVGYCSKDEDDAPAFSSTVYRSSQSDLNLMSYDLDCCMYIYGHNINREIWIDNKLETKPIFVCGSENVNDPAFADKRDSDMEEMNEHIREALAIAADYNLKHLVIVECDESYNVQYDIDPNTVSLVLDNMKKYKSISE